MVLLSGCLRSLLAALSEDRSPSQTDLDALNGLAERAVGAEYQDAAADFLITTLEATRAGRSASAERLLDLPDPELLAVVRYRVRQHAQQRLPRRRLFKAIRAHVAQALDRRTSSREQVAPVSLLKGGRLSGDLVGAGTYHLLATDPATPRSPSVITATLMAAYFPTAEREHDDNTTDPQVGLDAVTIAAELRGALGPELLRVVRHRSRGLPLQEIAQLEGVAVSTAHARLREAVLRLRGFAALRAVDVVTGRSAMAMLAA